MPRLERKPWPPDPTQTASDKTGAVQRVGLPHLRAPGARVPDGRTIARPDGSARHQGTRAIMPGDGQVERMNRTIKEATVQCYHFDDGKQLRLHLDQFVSAYNFGRRLKSLKGLTPYEAICRTWQSGPERFTANPLHQMPGLNT